MEIKKYLKIIKEIEENEGDIAKLYLIYLSSDYDTFKEMSEKQQKKLIDYIHTYYINNDNLSIGDIVDVIFNDFYYGKTEILTNIDKLSYKEFENILNEKY